MNEEVQGYIIMEATMEPMKPKIIRTVNEPNLFYVTFESCLQSFDCFNRNRRNYTLSAMKEGFTGEHVRELLYKGTWCGENGHPDSNDVKRILSIDMTKICHRICDVEFRGNLLYGTIETLNDEMWGRQFTMHVLQGLHPSFSLRALAAITKLPDGRGVIKTKPHIVTYDRVILPSHREAYLDNSKPITIVKTGTMEAASSIYSEESFNPAEENSFADTVHPISESAIPDALSYIAEESARFKELTAFYNDNWGEISLLNESTVAIKGEDNTRLIINLEDYIRQDISDLFKKL